MTKKDYELIARVISATRLIPGADSATLNSVAEVFISELEDDSPRFDADKFRKACR